MSTFVEVLNTSFYWFGN